MNTFQRAGATVGLSLAVGTGAYVAEGIFEPVGVDPATVVENYQGCAAIQQEDIRESCADNVEINSLPITWLGVVQLGCLATGVAGSVVAYRNMKNY